MFLPNFPGMFNGQIVYFRAYSLDVELGGLDEMRLALALEVRQSVHVVVEIGANCAPQPLERVLDIPLDDLAAFLARVAARLYHPLGGLGVLGQLLACLASELWCDQLDWDVAHYFSVNQF